MAGSLNKRIDIKKPATTQDDFGQPNQTWELVKSIWAGINPISGKEFLQGLAEQSQVTHRIIIRDGAGISPNMRVYYTSRIFEIMAVLNEAEADTKYTIMAKELFIDG
jgi:SPP1 family predicted phage head-tail adaptor